MAMTTFEKAREDWEPFSIYRSGGRIFHGYVSDIRIDRKTVPDGWYVYDMREWEGPDGISAYEAVDMEDNNDEAPLLSEIKNGYIFVDHMGTFVTQEDIGLAEGDSLFINTISELANNEFDYSFE